LVKCWNLRLRTDIRPHNNQGNEKCDSKYRK